jgi:hypothetical protein
VYRGYERFFPNHVYRDTRDGLDHALIIISGGYLMDDELAVACTRIRNPEEIAVGNGIPNCVACWAEVCS